MSIATSMRNNSLTAVIGNKVYTVASDHPNWKSILDAIEKGKERLVIELMDIPRGIQGWFKEGNVMVQNGEVFYGTRKLGGVVVDRILNFMSNGLPYKPMVKFINKLMSNPSNRSTEELYTFLEHKNLPITEEGNFLAYKGLTETFYSCTSGKIVLLQGKVNEAGQIFNGIGETIETVRNEVDDNKENHCSHGLHAGSMEYAKGFSRGKLVIVEIDPKDVVSIPSDCECQKLRTCKYKVIGEFEAPLNDNFQPSDEDIDDDCESGEVDVENQDDNDSYDDGKRDGVADCQGDASDKKFVKIRKTSKRKRSDYNQGYYDGWTDVRDNA